MANVSSSNGIEKYPRLRFKSTSDIPFPKWEMHTLSEYLLSRVEKQVPTDEAPLMAFTAEGGVEPKGDRYDRSYLVKSDSKLYKRTELGDFIYSSNNLDVGSMGLNRYGSAVISDVYEIFSIKDTAAPSFIDELIHRPNVLHKILQFRQGCLYGQYRIYADDFLSVLVLAPSKAEQQRISDFFASLDEKIRLQKKLIEHLKKYKRGLLDKLLEDNNADANWRTVRLQDVANGFEYGMNSAATTFDGVHKYIRITDIDDDSRQYLSDDIVSPSDTPEEKYRVNANDILFARTGASVGKSYLYNSEDGELYFAGFLIRISVKKEYDSYFVYLNTLTSKYEKWLRLESMRSGQPGVNAEQYRNYTFRCPNYQTQVKIANIIQGVDLRIAKERIILSELNSLKNGLLQQLFI